jgi:hypothetical protein
VDGVDRRLELVRPGPVAPEAAPDDRLALGDEASVPAGAVLVAQPDEVALRRGPGGPPRLDEQHQRQEPQHFRFVRHQVGQQPRQADRFGAEIVTAELVARARGVAFVEDQVDDGQYAPEAARQVGIAWHAVRDARIADLALGSDQPLRHGWLGDQEGAGDLGAG